MVYVHVAKGVERALLLLFLVDDEEMLVGLVGLVAKWYHDNVLPLLTSGAYRFVYSASIVPVCSLEGPQFHQYIWL